MTRLTVYDKDLNSKDLIGTVQVKTQDLLTEHETDRWLPIVYGSNDKSAGQLRIKTHMFLSDLINKMAEGIEKHYDLHAK
jgi:translation elongation factor EF-Tu-like GTPase